MPTRAATRAAAAHPIADRTASTRADAAKVVTLAAVANTSIRVATPARPTLAAIPAASRPAIRVVILAADRTDAAESSRDCSKTSAIAWHVADPAESDRSEDVSLPADRSAVSRRGVHHTRVTRVTVAHDIVSPVTTEVRSSMARTTTVPTTGPVNTGPTRIGRVITRHTTTLRTTTARVTTVRTMTIPIRAIRTKVPTLLARTKTRENITKANRTAVVANLAKTR